MMLEILYEDPDLLVINKPVGIIVNRAKTVSGDTVQDWMDQRFGFEKPPVGTSEDQVEKTKDSENEINYTDPKIFFERSGVVHRIDKETSGCLVLAKNPDAFFALQKAFKERSVKKSYVALAHGHLVPKTGEVNAPIGRLPWNREQFGVVPGGKEAHTHYVVERYLSDQANNSYSLINLFPTTGRTHQLRVHLKYLGFPIVGDYLYAGRKLSEHDRRWCPRVFLHASKISFPSPKNGITISVEAPLPQELFDILASLNPQ